MSLFWRLARVFGVIGACASMMITTNNVCAQGNVVMGFDGFLVNNTGGTSNPGFGGYGRFTYDMTVSESSELGRYGAFEILHAGASGSGVGFNFAAGDPNNPVDSGILIDPVAGNMFPLLDRAAFGTNFDPSLYVAELVFKPMPDNDGDQLNLTLDTFDGFDASGARIAEQWQWNFTGLATPTGTPDADGFYTVQNNGGSLAGANAGFDGPSYMFQTAPLPGIGDSEADFNEFEGELLPVPNGVHQIHLQTPYDDVSANDHFAIKSLRLVKINPDPEEVARIDGHTGFSNKFGSPFQNPDPVNIGGVDYFPSDLSNGQNANTNSVSRFDENGFTNIFISTNDDFAVGGLAQHHPPTAHSFDGSTASVEVTARLTEEQGAGQADRIFILVKDKDGNDTGPGDGGDEYRYELPLNQFNTSTMTTVSVPLTDFTSQLAGEFINEGDGLLTDFNLYNFGLETITGIGLVNMEIESLRITLPAAEGLTGDYNDDGFVNAADYVVWRNNQGTMNELLNDPIGGEIGEAQYTQWVEQFGESAGGGSTTASVPEPTSWLLGLVALFALSWRRSRTNC